MLEASPFRAFRAREVRAALARRKLDISHEAVSQRLHKMHRRRQIERVSIPGEWFSRWQARAADNA